VREPRRRLFVSGKNLKFRKILLLAVYIHFGGSLETRLEERVPAVPVPLAPTRSMPVPRNGVLMRTCAVPFAYLCGTTTFSCRMPRIRVRIPVPYGSVCQPIPCNFARIRYRAISFTYRRRIHVLTPMPRSAVFLRNVRSELLQNPSFFWILLALVMLC
jgi:hypothetical protein